MNESIKFGVSTLRERLDEAEKDTRRLDWILENCLVSLQEDYHLFDRQEIDAAMEAEAKQTAARNAEESGTAGPTVGPQA